MSHAIAHPASRRRQRRLNTTPREQRTYPVRWEPSGFLYAQSHSKPDHWYLMVISDGSIDHTVADQCTYRQYKHGCTHQRACAAFLETTKPYWGGQTRLRNASAECIYRADFRQRHPDAEVVPGTVVGATERIIDTL